MPVEDVNWGALEGENVLPTYPFPAIAKTPTVFSGLLWILSLQIMLAVRAIEGKGGCGKVRVFQKVHLQDTGDARTCILLSTQPRGHEVSIPHPLGVVETNSKRDCWNDEKYNNF